MEFNAEKYWYPETPRLGYDGRPVWVVTLIKHYRDERRKRREKRDVKHVKAATPEGAIRTARYHSLLTGKVSARARLATPGDLGCVPISATGAAPA